MVLRELAILDARAILEDAAGFRWPVTLTSPLGVVASLQGFTTDVGQTIDPDTGQAVSGRRASVSLHRASLAEMPEAIADATRKPWVATFADSHGVVASWKVVDVLPDRANGVVVMILEAYRPATVRLIGALTLPSLELSGEISPVAIIEGPSQIGPEAFALPPLQIAGSLQPLLFVLARSSQAFPVAATSHPVDVAALAGVGRRLLMFICTGLNAAIAPPVGWSEIAFPASTASAGFAMAIFWKDSDGSETTANVGLDAPRGALARIYAVAGAHGAAPELAVPVVNASVSGTNNVPSTVAPSWGLARNLYIAALGVDRSAAAPNIDANPIGYTDTGEIQNIGAPPADCALAFGEKIATSGSDTPSPWTYGPGRSISCTVAVRPV